MGLPAKLVHSQLNFFKPLVANCSLETIRRGQDKLGELMEAIHRKDVITRDHAFANFEGAWIIPKDERRQGVILYLHGGGYTCGDLDYAKGFGATLADEEGVRVFAAAYRLAPESPYPAAVEDALTAFDYLLKKGYAPHQILLCGESAGGGLIYALSLKLKQLGRELRGHRYHERDRGRAPAPKRQQPVLREHGRRALEPHDDGHHEGAHDGSVREALGVHAHRTEAHKERRAGRREERVGEAHEREHGQLPAQTQKRRARPAGERRERERARKRDRHENRLHGEHREQQDRCKKHRRHARMARVEGYVPGSSHLYPSCLFPMGPLHRSTGADEVAGARARMAYDAKQSSTRRWRTTSRWTRRQKERSWNTQRPRWSR